MSIDQFPILTPESHPTKAFCGEGRSAVTWRICSAKAASKDSISTRSVLLSRRPIHGNSADTKLQIPSTKLQRSTKSQTPNAELSKRLWSLELGASLGFGIWSLVLFARCSREKTRAFVGPF